MKRSASDKASMFLQYWRILAPSDLRPVAEYPFAKALRRKFRFDWAFPEYRVAVEVDGGHWLPGGGRHGGDGDREKLNIAASLRWLVFRYSPEMLKCDPAGCVEQVLKAIQDSQ